MPSPSFLLLLFATCCSMVVLVSSRRSYWCTVVSKKCECECGLAECVETIKCCIRYNRCYTLSVPKNECCPFRCENGGTRLPLRGKRAANYVAPWGKCNTEIPPPRCACPTGFEGRCCQTENPCAGFVCLDNQECEVHEPTGEPFCADSCEKTRCPHGQICQLDDVVCVREPCPPVAKCIDPCSNKECGVGQECLIYKPTGEAYCADTCDNRTCPEGQKCQLIPVVCVRAPCPPHAECVPIPTEKPGVCPKFDGITICLVECSSDADCPGAQKCCSLGCHVQCADPVLT